MNSRYTRMFELLSQSNEGAYVPFLMLGYPNIDESFEIIKTVVEAGADALELGVPYSDPIADGPTIQNAHVRALDAKVTVAQCLELIARVRETWPELPLGMLIYSNVAYVRGYDNFYTEFKEAGADSILLPDVPVRESAPFVDAAHRAGIQPIFIAPAQASEEVLEAVAASSEGYIYAISRDGVTGVERAASITGLDEVVDNVKRFGGAPILLGFGISEPQHVKDAISAGAAGAITGSAINKIIDPHVTGVHPQPGTLTDKDTLFTKLGKYISSMKAATKR